MKIHTWSPVFFQNCLMLHGFMFLYVFIACFSRYTGEAWALRQRSSASSRSAKASWKTSEISAASRLTRFCLFEKFESQNRFCFAFSCEKTPWNQIYCIFMYFFCANLCHNNSSWLISAPVLGIWFSASPQITSPVRGWNRLIWWFQLYFGPKNLMHLGQPDWFGCEVLHIKALMS